MSEVLGSFSAGRAALYIANRNCKPNELSLVFRKDGFPSVFSILALVWNLFQKLAFEQYWLFASSAPKVSCPDGIHSIDTGSVCNQKEELVLEKEKRVFNVFGPLKIGILCFLNLLPVSCFLTILLDFWTEEEHAHRNVSGFSVGLPDI